MVDAPPAPPPIVPYISSISLLEAYDLSFPVVDAELLKIDVVLLDTELYCSCCSDCLLTGGGGG